jgi:hypothetical protein
MTVILISSTVSSLYRNINLIMILFNTSCGRTQQQSPVKVSFNRHSYHGRARDNLHEHDRSHDIYWGINVQAGIIGRSVTGPYLRHLCLNGPVYCVCLLAVVPVLYEDVPLAPGMTCGISKMKHQHRLQSSKFSEAELETEMRQPFLVHTALHITNKCRILNLH